MAPKTQAPPDALGPSGSGGPQGPKGDQRIWWPPSASAGPQDDGVSRPTLRHFAAFKRKPAAVAALLAHPTCDPFVLDRKGRTPAEDTSDEAIRAAIIAAQEQVLAAVPKAAMSV